MKARFKGKVRLTDLDPPNSYRISGEGEGGIAGFAKGGATVALSDKDGGTLLTYNVEAQIGGKLAQLGQRLINGAAKKTRRRLLHQIRRGGERRARRSRSRVDGCTARPLTVRRVEVQSCSCSKPRNGRKSLDFAPILSPG